MIEVPTVLILGAGASAPFGFPTGEVLRQRILSNLADHASTEFRTLQAICTIAPKEIQSRFFQPAIEEFVEGFRDSSTPSVDAFLEHRSPFIDLGKAAIAQALLPNERPEAIVPGRDWYLQLATALDAPLDSLKANRLSVITFNYDRSLEYFLVRTWKHRYGLSDSDAQRLVSQVPIVHVHGQLGELLGSSGATTRPYGAPMAPADIYDASKLIRIVNESHAEDAFAAARALLHDVEQIVFLGLGYAPTNLRRLAIEEAAPNAKIFGTAFGLTYKERNDVNRRFFRGNAELGDQNWGSAQFMRERIGFLR